MGRLLAQILFWSVCALIAVETLPVFLKPSQAARTKQLAYYAIATVLALVAFGFAVGGTGLLIWQTYAWLRDGLWPVISTADVLKLASLPHSFMTTWVGIQIIVNWFFAQPASLMLWIVAFLFWFATVGALVRAEFQGYRAL